MLEQDIMDFMSNTMLEAVQSGEYMKYIMIPCFIQSKNFMTGSDIYCHPILHLHPA